MFTKPAPLPPAAAVALVAAALAWLCTEEAALATLWLKLDCWEAMLSMAAEAWEARAAEEEEIWLERDAASPVAVAWKAEREADAAATLAERLTICAERLDWTD